MIYEFVYVTIHYQCGHDALRPLLVGTVGRRERWSYDRCTHCTGLLERRYEANREREDMDGGIAPLSASGDWPPVVEVAV